MPLTERQRHAIEALDWLLDVRDGNRRTGRSIALAVALIRIALRNPNSRVNYTDHIIMIPHLSRDRSRDISARYIADIIHADPRLHTLPWRLADNNFSVSLSEPILDWWPDDAALGDMRERMRSPTRLTPLTERYNAESIRAAEDEAVFAALDNIARDGFDPKFAPKPAAQPEPEPLTAWERLNSSDD